MSFSEMVFALDSKDQLISLLQNENRRLTQMLGHENEKNKIVAMKISVFKKALFRTNGEVQCPPCKVNDTDLAGFLCGHLFCKSCLRDCESGCPMCVRGWVRADELLHE